MVERHERWFMGIARVSEWIVCFGLEGNKKAVIGHQGALKGAREAFLVLCECCRGIGGALESSTLVQNSENALLG